MFQVHNYNFFFLTFLFGITSAKVAPDFIHKCPELTPECLKKTIQDLVPEFVKGIPSLGLASIDPLNKDVPEFEIVPGLKLQLDKGRLLGIKTCIVDSAKMEDETLDLKVHCNLTIKGQYKAVGKILIMTLNGDGDAKIKANNVKIHAKIRFQDVKRDGVIYRVIKDYNVKHKFEDRVTFSLTNIFKGNPELSNVILTFLNENWKAIADEIGRPIVDICVSVLVDILKKFFEVVPKNEIFD